MGNKKFKLNKKIKQKGGGILLDSSSIKIDKIKTAKVEIIHKVSMFHILSESFLLNNIIVLFGLNNNLFVQKLQETNLLHLDTTKVSTISYEDYEKKLSNFANIPEYNELNDPNFLLVEDVNYFKYQFIISLVATSICMKFPETILYYKDMFPDNIEFLNEKSVENMLKERELLIPKYEILRYILNPLHQIANGLFETTKYDILEESRKKRLAILLPPEIIKGQSLSQVNPYDFSKDPLSYIAWKPEETIQLPNSHPKLVTEESADSDDSDDYHGFGHNYQNFEGDPEKIFFTLYFDSPLIDFLKEGLNHFVEEIMKPFAEDIIPKLKDIYVKNPSLETAKLLAIIGIPSKPFSEILNPPPNSELKQSEEEKAVLAPLITLLNDIETKYEKFLNQMFYNRFVRTVTENPHLKSYEIVEFNVKIKTLVGTEKEIKTNQYEKIENIKNSASWAFEIEPDDFNLVFGRFGVMDNERAVTDYNLQEGSTINLVLKTSSGLIGKPKIIRL